MTELGEALKRAESHSQYLRESLSLFPELALKIPGSNPAHLFDNLLAAAQTEIQSLETEMANLRLLKRQCHLVIAIADIAKVWDWEPVTEHLTRLADLCIQRILAASARELELEGTKENPVPGFFVLAVGKYGARELNYSSDIDFNVFYDPEKISVPNPARAERTLIKLVQNIVKGMESMTEDGYIFRTDLRLRPDPRSNAVAVSTRTAERYYETIGQNWERAAMIKARTCAGDIQAGNRFIEETLSPFIWRKNMDYAAIEDILAIKRQIHARAGAGKDFDLAGHNIKLGFGGIREIEFYAQVQQLILGGRDPELRTPRTVEALSELARKSFITELDQRFLTEAYAELRRVEHGLQMLKDEQTHTVPADEEGQTQAALLLGFDDFAHMSMKLGAILKQVRTTYQDLFPEAGSLSSREGNMVFTGVEPDPDTLAAFEKLGYKGGEKIWHEMAAWLGGRIRATRSEKARELLTILAPRIIESCADTGQPDRAFECFGRFFTSLRSGISLLSMFRQKPEHLRYIINLITESERISNWISDRPAILDALSDPGFLDISEADIQRSLLPVRRAEDFEAALNMSRRRARETKFRISAALISGKIDAALAATLFSRLAEECLLALLPVSIAEAERRMEKITGNVAILAMGKLASGDLNIESDLDIMLIYQAGPNEDNAQQKYTKVTQRLISALSAITEEGPLYEVDMALRPSGRSGPVAVSVEAFETYYREKAWSWEFMALTRTRVIAATRSEFSDDVEQMRKDILACDRSDLDMPADIADMLKRVRREKPAAHAFDLKNAIGGIRDIEFIAQKLLLDRRKNSQLASVKIEDSLRGLEPALGDKAVGMLIENYAFYLAMTQHLSTRFEQPWNPQDLFLDGVLRAAKNKSRASLLKALKTRQAETAKIVDKIIFD